MEFRPHDFARRWVEDGHEVTILAASFSHLRSFNPRARGRSTEEWLDGVRFRWIRTPSYEGNGLGRIRSIHAFLRGVDRERRTWMQDRDVDAVIASSTYPFDIDPCQRLAREKKALLVWEVHDLWPLSPIELAGYSPRHPFIRVTQRAEDRCCRQADLVVSMLPHAIDHLATRGLDESRYVHIPNGASEPEASPAGRSESPARLVESLRSKGDFVLVHAGGVGEYHGLSNLLEAASRCRRPGLSVVIIGDGPNKDRLRRDAARLNLPDVHFVPRVSRYEAVAAMRASSATFAGLQAHSIYRFGIGLNKIYDGMLSGRPIVAAYTAGNDPIKDAACGISVPADQPGELAGAIESLRAATPMELDAMGESGRCFVRKHHDHATLARRFMTSIQEASPRGSIRS